MQRDCLAHICKRFLAPPALADAAGKARHFCYHVAIFSGIQKNSSRHIEILPVEIILRQCFKRFTLVRLVLSLLRFRQLVRFVIGFAVELLNFFFKVRPVITISV